MFLNIESNAFIARATNTGEASSERASAASGLSSYVSALGSFATRPPAAWPSSRSRTRRALQPVFAHGGRMLVDTRRR